MIVLATQRRDLIRFGHHARRALDVLAAQLDALPVAGILDAPIQGEGFPIDGQQIVAAIAARKANIQMVEALLFTRFPFQRWQLYFIVGQ